MPGTVLSMQNIYLVKKNYANPLEGDTKPPEDSASMKFVYHQLNSQSVFYIYSDDELRFMYENGQGHLTLFCIVFV